MGKYDTMLLLVVCNIILKLSDAACTWPTDFQSTGTDWRDSDKGILNFSSNSHMTGWSVTVRGTKVSSWDCFIYNASANIVIARASSHVIFSQYIYVPYLCMKMTKITDHTYIYYLKSGEESAASYERVYIREEGSSNSASATQSELCGGSPNDSEYHTLLRWASRAFASVQCPTVLLGSFSYSYNNFSTSTCGNGIEVWNGCTDIKSMAFNYTMCHTRIAYSEIGTVRCIVSFTSGTYSFATVYNTDLSTDESTTYLFTCMMASKSGSKVAVSLSPKSCTKTQTPDAVPVNATNSTLGANMILAPYFTCVPTTAAGGGGSSTNNTVMDATIIVVVSVVAGFLLVIVTVLVFYIVCIRDSKKAHKESATRLDTEMQKKQKTKSLKKSKKVENGSNLPDVDDPVLDEHKLNGVIRAMEKDRSSLRTKALVVDRTPKDLSLSPQNTIRVKSADDLHSEFEDESLPATPITPRRYSSNTIPFRENPKDVSTMSERSSKSQLSEKILHGKKEKKAMSRGGSVENEISGRASNSKSIENETSRKTGNDSEVMEDSMMKRKDQEGTSLAKWVEQGGQNRQEIRMKTDKQSPLVNNTSKKIANDFKTTENSVDNNKNDTSYSTMTKDSETTEKSDENKKIEIWTARMAEEPAKSNRQDQERSADIHTINNVSDAKQLEIADTKASKSVTEYQPEEQTVSPDVSQETEGDKAHIPQNYDKNEQMNQPSQQKPDLDEKAVMPTPVTSVYVVNKSQQRKRKPKKTSTKRSKSHKNNTKEKKTHHKDAKGDEQLIPSKDAERQDNFVDEEDKGDTFAKEQHQQVKSDKKEESTSSDKQVPQTSDSNQNNTKALSPEPKSSPANVVPPLLFQQIQENAENFEEKHDHVETDRTGFTTDSECASGRTEEEDIFDDTVTRNLLSSVTGSISTPRSRLNSLEAASRASSKLIRTPTGISLGLIGYKEGTGFFPELPTHYETGQPPNNSLFLTKMNTDPPKLKNLPGKNDLLSETFLDDANER